MAYNFGLDEEQDKLNVRPEILQYMQERQANPTPTPALNPSILQYFDDKKMQEAQTKADENAQMAGLARAGSMIGGAISGVKTDAGAYDRLDTMAQDPVKQLQAQRQGVLDKFGAETKMREVARLASAQDPNSPRAKLFQEANKKYAGNIDLSGMSLEDMKDASPLFERAWQTEEKAKERKSAENIKRIEADTRRKEKLDELGVKHVKDAQTEFENNPLTKQNRERLEAADDVRRLLSSNNPVADEVSKSRLARLSGEVGVLTDTDIGRFGGSKAFVSRLNNAIEQATSGQLSNENRKFMLDVTETMAQRSKDALAKYATTKAKQLSVRLGKPESETYKYLMPDMQQDREDSSKKTESPVDPQLVDYANKYTDGDVAKAKRILDARRNAPTGGMR